MSNIACQQKEKIMINWVEATPINSLIGGMLIGAAAAMLILFNGKIAGISGILGELLRPKKNDTAWRVMFLLGLVISPLIYSSVHPLPVVTVNANSFMIIIAGVLVGVGTRYGSGCTSGHGICGIARLSPRSILATITFILAGAVTVLLSRLIAQ
jgi:uncharacterized membrane protein YedE/YeeE